MKAEKSDRRGCPPGQGVAAGKSPDTGEAQGQIGNPPHEPTDADRERVALYAKVMNQDMIAASFDPPISAQTLRKYYRKELDQGTLEAVASVGGKLLAKALSGNITAMIFYLRTRGKWSSRVEVTGPDGAPVLPVDLAQFLEGKSEEELAILGDFIEQLLAQGGLDVSGGHEIGLGANQEPSI